MRIQSDGQTNQSGRTWKWRRISIKRCARLWKGKFGGPNRTSAERETLQRLQLGDAIFVFFFSFFCLFLVRLQINLHFQGMGQQSRDDEKIISYMADERRRERTREEMKRWGERETVKDGKANHLDREEGGERERVKGKTFERHPKRGLIWFEETVKTPNRRDDRPVEARRSEIKSAKWVSVWWKASENRSKSSDEEDEKEEESEETVQIEPKYEDEMLEQPFPRRYSDSSIIYGQHWPVRL